ECEGILNSIEEAYSVNGFPENRRDYDRMRGFIESVMRQSYAFDSSSALNPHDSRTKDKILYEDYGSNLLEAKVSKLTAQKKFALEFEQNTEMENKIQECSEWSGAFLKKVREYRNVSIERMAEMTRISKTHINALEDENMQRLP